MDSDSGDVDGVGCGGAGGSIGAGGIGAGGSGNKKGLNAYKHVAADKRKERLPPQDDLPPPPLRVTTTLILIYCVVYCLNKTLILSLFSYYNNVIFVTMILFIRFSPTGVDSFLIGVRYTQLCFVMLFVK